MNNIPLTVVEGEKDIGVLFHHSLKQSRQCSEAARKANAVLGQISRSFHYRDKNVFMKLDKSHVRSHLEFSVPDWSPWTEADKLVLENVQKRAVRMVSGLSGSYEENLKDLNLQSLEDRRIRYDMIQTRHDQGQISRSFHYRDKNVLMKLYKSHVRSHLVFSVPAWSTWTEADKLVLENVQKRAVRMVSGLSGSYEENLKDLNLQSLEDRRLRYDMIQTYKIIKEIDAVQPSTWFNLAGDNPTRRTRLTDNPINILPSRSRLEIRNNFFSQRVPEQWNNLPDSLKNSRNLTIFKRDLTKHMRNI